MADQNTKLIKLPEWASFVLDDRKRAKTNGESLQILANGPEMYETMFALLRTRYADGHPDFNDTKGKLRPAWKSALEDLNSKEPSAYWCEVAYQMAKLQLQSACSVRQDGSSPFALNIRVTAAPGKPYAQKKRAKTNGRDPALASHGREARAHFRRVFGFMVA